MTFLKIRGNTILNVELIVDINMDSRTIWLVNDYQYKLSDSEFEVLMEKISGHLL